MELFGNDKRSLKMLLNVKISLVMKILTAVMTFLQVPLVLKCLGTYQSGVWLTISSLILWVDVFDIGLGNGLRNKLAESIAKGCIDEAKDCIASTFYMLALIITPIYVIFIFLINNIDVYSLLNIDTIQIPNLRLILSISLTLVCLTFVLKIIGNVYMGMQMPSVNNIIQTIGLMIGLIATYIMYLFDFKSLLGIVIVNIAAPLFIYSVAIPYTFSYKYPQLRPDISNVKLLVAMKLAKTGVSFFVIQLSSLFLFASSNAMISSFFNPATVTPFQIAYKYMSLLTMIFSIFAMPLWSATTDAYTRNEMSWIRQADKKVGHLMLIIIALFFAMIIFAPVFYHLWIGNDVNIPFSYTLLLGIYVLIVVYSTRYSFFLNGIGALRLQLITTTISAFLFVTISYYTSMSYHNINVFMIIMILTLLPGVIINKIQFSKILNGRAVGVWKVI